MVESFRSNITIVKLLALYTRQLEKKLKDLAHTSKEKVRMVMWSCDHGKVGSEGEGRGRGRLWERVYKFFHFLHLFWALGTPIYTQNLQISAMWENQKKKQNRSQKYHVSYVAATFVISYSALGDDPCKCTLHMCKWHYAYSSTKIYVGSLTYSKHFLSLILTCLRCILLCRHPQLYMWQCVTYDIYHTDFNHQPTQRPHMSTTHVHSLTWLTTYAHPNAHAWLPNLIFSFFFWSTTILWLKFVVYKIKNINEKKVSRDTRFCIVIRSVRNWKKKKFKFCSVFCSVFCSLRDKLQFI
jgi:hypothetical protein